MEKGEALLKEFKELENRILEGNYENLEKEKARYNKLREELKKQGYEFLDGINFETFVF